MVAGLGQPADAGQVGLEVVECDLDGLLGGAVGAQPRGVEPATARRRLGLQPIEPQVPTAAGGNGVEHTGI